ncbi:MAG: tetratricopeptide repeat protein [Parachlamydiaceae bacterium]|nr:tetratricopeptide repeat protein [Parachlamydiaceae bacterium]
METIENFRINPDKLQETIDAGQWDLLMTEENGVQKLLAISDETLQRYYEVSSQLLKENQWSQARDAFRFLTFLNPYVHSFWMGLGIAEQTQGNFEQAIIAYMLGEVTDPNDPIVHANALQCYVALGDKALAGRAYQIALDLCDSSEGYTELKENLLNYRRSVAI